jgi:hypothetical protein
MNSHWHNTNKRRVRKAHFNTPMILRMSVGT